MTVLSFFACPLLPVLFRLSSSVCPFLAVLSWQPCSDILVLPVQISCLAPSVLFCLSCSVFLLPGLFCRSFFLAVPPSQSCPGCPLPAVMCWQPGPANPVQAVLSWQHCLFCLFCSDGPSLPWPALFYLSCLCCPILTVMSNRLSYPSSPILATLSGQSCQASPLRAALSWQSCYSACHAASALLRVLFCLSCFTCPVLPVPIWMFIFGCPVSRSSVLTILSWQYIYVHICTDARARKTRSAKAKVRNLRLRKAYVRRFKKSACPALESN